MYRGFKDMERWSVFLAVREMKIKTTMRSHLTTLRMAIINTHKQTTSVGEVVEKKEP